jgi:hypothetical protein
MKHQTPIEATITIHVVFGSDLQRDSAMKVLRHLLHAWRQLVEAGHKKNNVTIHAGSMTE